MQSCLFCTQQPFHYNQFVQHFSCKYILAVLIPFPLVVLVVAWKSLFNKNLIFASKFAFSLFDSSLVDISQWILNGGLHFTQSASNGLSQAQWWATALVSSVFISDALRTHFAAVPSRVLPCASWRTSIWPMETASFWLLLSLHGMRTCRDHSTITFSTILHQLCFYSSHQHVQSPHRYAAVS